MMSAARSCSRRAALVAVLASALQHFKPSEPFLLPYLVRSLGVSEDEIGARVFPVYSYAAFGAMLALPAADAAARAAGAGYKSLLVVCAASRLGTRALLIFGASDVRLMQIMQVMYGISEATNVVTLCYLYRVLPVRAFADATAATGAAGAVSYVIAAELGQLMIGGGRSDNNESGGKADATHYLPLFWVSFAAVAAGLVLTLLLPGDAERSAAEDVALAGTPLGEQRVPAGTMVDAGQVRAGCDSQHGVRPPLPARLRALYSPTRVRLLSLWWALALAVLGVAENFSTNMLCAVDAGTCETQSGHLTAVARIGTAVCSLAAARLAVPRLEKSTSAIVAVLLGGLFAMGSLLLASGAANGVLEFACAYVGTLGVSHALQTCVFSLSAVAASGVGDYIALFSINTAAALGVGAALTAVLEGSLALSARGLYSALGACCVVLAVGTAVPAAWWGRRRRSQGFVALDEVECGGIESGATEDPADEAAASELMSAHGSLAESP